MTDQLATKGQGFTIYKHLGYDIRPAGVYKDQASKVIELSIAGRTEDAIHLLETLGAEKKREVKPKKDKRSRNFEKLFKEAVKLGQEKAESVTPTPMVVVEHENQAQGLMGGDPGPIKRAWKVKGGVCGFAWVHFPDARKSFVKWLKSEGLGRKDSYRGGWFLSSMYKPPKGEGPLVQSLAINEAWVEGFVNHLNKNGIKCYFRSRID